MRLIHVDLSPLRVSASFRRLYLAGFFSALGNQATSVAIAFQLRQITHSALAVGSLGLVELVPLIVFGLYGGVMADRLDRQRVALLTEAAMALCAGTLVLNSFDGHPRAWPIFVVGAVLMATMSLQTPSIGAMGQLAVPHDLQRASAQLFSIRMTTMSLLGPALGGLMATTIGPGWGYVLNLGTFVFSLSLLALLGSHQPVATETESQLAMLREGARYVRSRVDIVGSYVVDIIAMAFAYPVIMLPFVAARYHEHWALSLLYMALPFGALAAQLFNKWTHHVHRYGQAIVYSSMVWGLGIAVFGWFNPLWIVFTGLALAGAADSYSATFRQTLWNESILPEIRGRMGGVELISYAVGPLAGQFRSGAMTSWLGLRSSLALGGVACAIGDGVAGLGLPALWRFDERTDVHVAAVRTARQHDTESEHS